MQHDSTTPPVDSRNENEAAPLLSQRLRHPNNLFASLVIGGCLTVACWLGLLRWYSLVEHYPTPGFAFDKIPGHIHSPVVQGTALIFSVLGLLYIAMYLLIRAAPTLSSPIKTAIGVTVATSGAINVLLYPVAAIDLFYYLCQLKLAYYYQQNPYVVTFAPSFAADPFAAYAWPLEVPSIYGAAWLLISAVPAAVAGFENLLRLLVMYKLFSFALLALSGWVIAQCHADEKNRWLAAYTLLANPLVLFEGVANAHNDVMMTLFLLLAVVALKRQSVLALPLLTITALIKALSVVLFPLFLLVMVTGKWKVRTILLSVLLAAALSFVAIAPFWSGGRMVAGLLQGMTFASTFATPSIASFVREYLHQLGASEALLSVFRFTLGCLFVSVSILIVLRMREWERVFAYVLLIFFTLVVALQPWYLIPVIALLSIKHDPVEFAFIALAATLGLLVNILDIWARFSSGLSFGERHLLGTVYMNVPIVVVLVLELWLSWRRIKQPGLLGHGSAHAQ